MKIFQTFIINLRTAGIYWPQKYQTHPFNGKNIAILFNLGLFIVLAMVFILLEAETFSEYADSFYLIATTIFCEVMFVVTIWKTPKFFQLINDFETLIQKRESNARLKNNFTYNNFVSNKVKKMIAILGIDDLSVVSMYEEANKSANKWANMLQISLTNVTFPCVMLPNLILTLYNHFVGESDVYLLAFPMW